MLKEYNKDFLNVYLCGTILGGELKKYCINWRFKIRHYYENYNGKGIYEINFLDPMNGELEGELDKEGLTNSKVSGNTIYQGDVLAVKKADIIVANFNDFGSSRIAYGTFFECGMALAWRKPLIIICSQEDYERCKTHPFTSQASAIFKSVDEFLESKILNWYYKRLNSAIYDWQL